jgi:hypothetical protein
MTARGHYHEVTVEDGVPVLHVLTKARAGSWAINDHELRAYIATHGRTALVQFRCPATDFSLALQAHQIPRGFKKAYWDYRTVNKADLRRASGGK